MYLRMLGTLSLDDTPVTGDRVGRLLRTLVLARGRSVPGADLVDAVWDGDAPADPRGALQALASRLRRAGLVVSAVGTGYRVDLAGVEVDLHRAQADLSAALAAAARGDHEEAVRNARHGLDLFVGPAGDQDVRLHTELLSAGASAALALGEVPSDLDALRAAADLTPTDEPLAAVLLRALAAAGREAEALERYEALRTVLAERYGTDPSQLVATVHLALVRGELGGGRPAAPPLAAPTGQPAPDVIAPPTPAWRPFATPLVGRDADVDVVEQQLVRSALVTLVAVGGAGKTRLAAEVAGRAAARGLTVHPIELAGIRDAAEVLPAVLAALGGSDTTTDLDDPLTRHVLQPAERVRRAVGALDGLVVLDNCEHLLDVVADLVADLLTAAGPDLRILATSRAALGVVGETVHAVTSLPEDAALELLESRARAGRSGLAWDDGVARELCRRLDNLPLALELAAARLRTMPLVDVLAGVEHRFALLDHALRGLPDRHRGLWAMVDWNWALLDPSERTLLCDLAVVPAPFTADLAATVSGSGATAARLGLASLAEQSLLSIEEEPDGPARYRMLETVREYGEARLAAEQGARDRAMRRLADWAAGEAHRLGADFIGAGQVAAITTAARETDTFLAALRWSIDHDHHRASFAVTGVMAFLWSVRGQHLEYLTWAQQILLSDDPIRRRAFWHALTHPGDGDSVPHSTDAVLVSTVAMLTAGVTGDMRLAALARRIGRWASRFPEGVPEHRTRALLRLALELPTARDDGHPQITDELVDDDDPYLRALGHALRASVRENHAELTDSDDDARLSYELFESIGDHWGMAMAAQQLGQWAPLEAKPSDGRGADEWLALAMHHMEIVGAHEDARTLSVLRDLRNALLGVPGAEAALERAAESDAQAAQARSWARLGLAVVASRDGRQQEAVRRADEAVAVARADPWSPPQSRIVAEVAAAVVRSRAGEDGTDLLMSASTAALGLPDMPVLGSVALGWSELEGAGGDVERSVELWALGRRLGANLHIMFGGALTPAPAGDDEREQREVALAAAAGLGLQAVVDRLRQLLA